MGRASRRRRERREQPPEPPSRSRRPFYVAGAVAALLAVALVGLSVLSGRDSGETRSPGAPVAGAAQTTRLLRGIPQDGSVLGASKAPVTLVEYADLQCPYCAQWAVETLPVLVNEYVRRGDVKVIFRGLAWLGPDSETALRSALAAGQQDRLWHVVHLLYENQGKENSGWVTDETLSAVFRAVPSLDGAKVYDERFSAGVESRLQNADRAAREAGVSGTPSFAVGRSGSRLVPLEIDSLGPESFRPALDELLRR